MLLRSFFDQGPSALLNDHSIVFRLSSLLDFWNGMWSIGGVPSTGLNGGVSRLVVDFGIFGIAIILIIVLASPYKQVLVEVFRSVSLSIAFITIVLIGPVSLPALFIWMASYDKAFQRNYSSY